MSVKSNRIIVALSFGTIAFGCRPSEVDAGENPGENLVQVNSPATPEPAATATKADVHAQGTPAPFAAHAGAPYVLELEGPDTVDAGSTVTLTATLDVRAHGLPLIELAVQLPEGATLLSGQATERILEPAVGSLTRTFEIAIEDIPRGDVSVVAEITRPDGLAGAHARRTYRFGRAEPKARPIVREAAKGRPGREIRLDRMRER
jgi:hypothetical protein